MPAGGDEQPAGEFRKMIQVAVTPDLVRQLSLP
jgi:hypothetical protein